MTKLCLCICSLYIFAQYSNYKHSSNSQAQMTSKEIFNYILITGYNLSSEKILKQPENNQQTIWEIIVHLCSRIKNKNRESNFATYVYLMQDHEKHQQSCKWLKQFLMVSYFLKKINLDYGIIDYLKPQKEKIYLLLSKIVQVCKQVDKTNFQNDQLLVKKDLNQKEIQITKQQYKRISEDLQNLKQKKRTQLPLYEQKIKSISSLNGEILSKKQQKADVIAVQRDLINQKKNKMTILQKKIYQREESKITIMQLQKEVTVNAPQIKKQKFELQETYQNLSSQFNMLQQLIKAKQRNTINQIKKREQIRDVLQKQSKQILNNLQNISYVKNYVCELQTQNSKLNQNKKQLQFKESSINNQIQRISSSNMYQLKKCSQMRHVKQQNLLIFNSKQSQQEKLNVTLKSLKQSYEKRQGFKKGLQDKIAHRKKLYGFRQSEIRQQVESLRKLITQKSDQIYEVYLNQKESK